MRGGGDGMGTGERPSFAKRHRHPQPTGGAREARIILHDEERIVRQPASAILVPVATKAAGWGPDYLDEIHGDLVLSILSKLSLSPPAPLALIEADGVGLESWR